MARALVGYVGTNNDRVLALEIARLRRRVAELEAEVTELRETTRADFELELHRISAALDLGDIPQVIESGARVNVDHLPVERQVTHLIDLARAYSLVAKDDDALQTLLTAEQKSPTIVRHSSPGRKICLSRRKCRIGWFS